MSMVIFDFDGTLVDSYHLSLDGVNAFCREKNIPTVESLEEMQQHFWKTLLRYHVKLFGVRRYVLNYMAEQIVHCQMPDSLQEALFTLHSRGHVMGIISSNRRVTVERYLEHHNLSHLFRFILHASWSRSKAYWLQQIRLAEHLPEDQLFYVCDSVDDIEQAEPRIAAIAVSWGYETESTLSAAKPRYLIKNPIELSTIPELSQAKPVKA